MYRVNYTGRPVLLTYDEFMKHAATDSNVDMRQVIQNIVIAEERWIAPALGDELYLAICAEKNTLITSTNQAAQLALVNASLAEVGAPAITAQDMPVGEYVNAIETVTTAAYSDLWKMYLAKLCAECVDLTTIIPSWLRHTSQGQQKNNPEVIGGNGQNSASGDRKDVQFKIDKFVQDRIDPLIARMQLYICKRITDFALYCHECESNNPNGVSWKRKTDFVFLDDDDSTCGTCSGDMNFGNVDDAIIPE